MGRRRMKRARGVRRFVIDGKRNVMREETTFQDGASLLPPTHSHTHTHTHTKDVILSSKKMLSRKIGEKERD